MFHNTSIIVLQHLQMSQMLNKQQSQLDMAPWTKYENSHLYCCTDLIIMGLYKPSRHLNRLPQVGIFRPSKGRFLKNDLGLTTNKVGGL